jgi:hypothetical protein
LLVVTSDEDFLDEYSGHMDGPIDWSRTDPAVPSEEWDELRNWVQWLVNRYALDCRVVPPCWYLHPSVVDVLSALRDHHRSSFDLLGLTTGPADWHLAFRHLESRLREWASRTGCARDAHRPDVPPEWPDDTSCWATHLAAYSSAPIADRRPRVGATAVLHSVRHPAVDINDATSGSVR